MLHALSKFISNKCVCVYIYIYIYWSVLIQVCQACTLFLKGKENIALIRKNSIHLPTTTEPHVNIV